MHSLDGSVDHPVGGAFLALGMMIYHRLCTVENVNSDLYAGSRFRPLKTCIQRRSITGLQAFSFRTAYGMFIDVLQPDASELHITL
jgi:hypothetical protein